MDQLITEDAKPNQTPVTQKHVELHKVLDLIDITIVKHPDTFQQYMWIYVAAESASR